MQIPCSEEGCAYQSYGECTLRYCQKIYYHTKYAEYSDLIMDNFHIIICTFNQRKQQMKNQQQKANLIILTV